MTVFVNNVPVNNLEIAHIRAAEKNGPRWDPAMSEADRAHFDNLILLCRPHHKMVDSIAPADYPVEALTSWKSERERGAAAQLRSLRQLTEEGLQEIIAQVVRSRDEELQSALDRFSQVDSEAASVLRGLVDELQYLQRRPLLDQDVVHQLQLASENLHYLSVDNVHRLYLAAEGLSGLNVDTVHQLYLAAEGLSTLKIDTVRQLYLTAQKLEELIPRLHEAVNSLRSAHPEL
ncbi:hypothetical protein [Cryptosporangium aurantiacum]|uniref:hypothetical protein n=1 Tax=Cryptosporangium aurantiacum TaxID=134849 RepID=UPI001160E2D5|nr:hypothetical protein [Cryptosporangium aurantiacum]